MYKTYYLFFYYNKIIKKHKDYTLFQEIISLLHIKYIVKKFT